MKAEASGNRCRLLGGLVDAGPILGRGATGYIPLAIGAALTVLFALTYAFVAQVREHIWVRHDGDRLTHQQSLRCLLVAGHVPTAGSGALRWFVDRAVARGIFGPRCPAEALAGSRGIAAARSCCWRKALRHLQTLATEGVAPLRCAMASRRHVVGM